MKKKIKQEQKSGTIKATDNIFNIPYIHIKLREIVKSNLDMLLFGSSYGELPDLIDDTDLLTQLV